MPRLLADITPLRVSAEYRRLWSALAISNLGTQMTSVAVGIQVYAITGSSLAVGLVGFFGLVPLVVFGLYGGALSDSHDRRWIGLLTALGLGACAAVLVAQSAVGSTSVALLYAVVAVQSALYAIGSPARSAMIPRLVGVDLLPAANALAMLSWNIGFTVGPLLGGVLIATTGSTTVAYTTELVAFVAVVYAMVRMRPMPPHEEAPRTAGWESVKQGIAFLKGKRNLQMSFYVDIAAMVFGMPRALFPAIATMWFVTSSFEPATIVGMLSAAPAVGAIVTSLMSGSLGMVRRQGLAVVLAIVVWGSSIAAFGLSRWLPLSLLLLAIAGGADNVSAIFRNTIMQAASPDEYRGRLSGIYSVVVSGGPRLGDVESGGVAALAGETFSVVSGGIACLVATGLLVAWIPSFLKYDARHPTP